MEASRVADPHHFNADPDPAFYFDADPDPASKNNKDPDLQPFQQKSVLFTSVVDPCRILPTFQLVSDPYPYPT